MKALEYVKPPRCISVLEDAITAAFRGKVCVLVQGLPQSFFWIAILCVQRHRGA